MYICMSDSEPIIQFDYSHINISKHLHLTVTTIFVKMYSYFVGHTTSLKAEGLSRSLTHTTSNRSWASNHIAHYPSLEGNFHFCI